MEDPMKKIFKAALAAAVIAGAGGAAVPAEAAVGFSFGFSTPGYGYRAPPPAYNCYGPYYYARCGYSVWGGPVFYNGFWFNSVPYREYRGRREFWIHHGWRGDVRFRDRDSRWDRDDRWRRRW